MNAARFHNALRILLGLDKLDLLTAGVIDANWGSALASHRDQVEAFMADPVGEAIRMPDANFDRLVALVHSRQRPLPPVTGPSHGPALVDQLRLIGSLAGTTDKRGHQDQRDTVAYVETVTADMLAVLKEIAGCWPLDSITPQNAHLPYAVLAAKLHAAIAKAEGQANA